MDLLVKIWMGPDVQLPNGPTEQLGIEGHFPLTPGDLTQNSNPDSKDGLEIGGLTSLASINFANYLLSTTTWLELGLFRIEGQAIPMLHHPTENRWSTDVAAVFPRRHIASRTQ